MTVDRMRKSSPKQRCPRTSPSETIGWGIVGCGWVARDYVLPGLRAIPNARLVGVCDRDPRLAHRVAATVGGFATGNLDTLLDRPDLHAVYVATPNHAHAAVVTAVAERGIPVLCEKPLAADLVEARVLVAAAGGGLAGTAFDQRFHPAHRRITELVVAGELGTVTAVRIVYGCWLPPDWKPPGNFSAAHGNFSSARSNVGATRIAVGQAHRDPTADPYDNWRIDRVRAGGGALIDLAPHGLDLVGALLGDDLERLAVVTQQRVHDYPVDDGAVLTGRTGGGVLFTAHVSFNTADPLPRRRLEVVGTRAQLVAENTMGQTPGGTLTRIDARTGAPTTVVFDTITSPFTAQLAAFGAAVAGVAAWPWPLHRDLYLHELLHAALERS